MIRFVVVSLALLALPIAVPVLGSPPSGEGWSSLRSENFTLFSDLEEGATSEIGLDLERLRAVLEQIFPQAELESPLETLIYVFRDRESFEPYSLPGGGSGYFAPHKHANFAAVVGSDPDQALPVVYRQYLQEVINNNVPQMPLWFKYGLAEIFSTFEADGDRARVARVPAGSDGLGLAGAGRSSVPEVLARDSLPTGGEGMSSFVQGSWALMHYLLVDDDERFAATRRFVGLLRDDPTSPITITEVLGTDPETLESDLERYLASEPLPHREMPLPASLPSTVSPVAMSPQLTLFHLGDLLAHATPDRMSEAEAHFRAALALEPDFAPAVAGLGYVSESAGDLATAESRYEEALGHEPDAFRLQALFGEVELALLGKRRPRDAEGQARLDRALAALRRTVELRPDYGEGWALLGYAYNLTPQPSARAVPILEKAYEMLPGRGDVAYNLLLGYARAGKRDEAIALVATAEARGLPEERLAPARQTLLQLDFQYAVELTREKRFDEAVPLLEKIGSEASDATMRQQATDLLRQIRP